VLAEDRSRVSWMAVPEVSKTLNHAQVCGISLTGSTNKKDEISQELIKTHKLNPYYLGTTERQIKITKRKRKLFPIIIYTKEFPPS